MDRKAIAKKCDLYPAEITRMLNRVKYPDRHMTWRQAAKLHIALGRSVKFWLNASPTAIQRILDGIK